MLMGYKVRQCHYAGREPYTARAALDVLVLAYLFLKALEGDAARKTQYVRGVLLQLLTWTKWHDKLPGACFSMRQLWASGEWEQSPMEHSGGCQ